MDSFIDDFIDAAYDALTDDTIGILRLLIANLPECVRRIGNCSSNC